MKMPRCNTPMAVAQIDRHSNKTYRAALYWPGRGLLEGILQAFRRSTQKKTIDRLEETHAMD